MLRSIPCLGLLPLYIRTGMLTRPKLTEPFQIGLIILMVAYNFGLWHRAIMAGDV